MNNIESSIESEYHYLLEKIKKLQLFSITFIFFYLLAVEGMKAFQEVTKFIFQCVRAATKFNSNIGRFERDWVSLHLGIKRH